MFFREGKGACVMRYDFQKFVRYPPGSSVCKCMICFNPASPYINYPYHFFDEGAIFYKVKLDVRKFI